MHRSDHSVNSVSRVTFALLLGALLALCVAVLVLLLGAVAVSGDVLTEEAAAGICVAACGFGCLFGGLFSCGRMKSGRLPVGAGTGLVCFLLLFVWVRLSGEGVASKGQASVEFAACVCGGTLAGLLWKKKKKWGKKTSVRTK